MALTFASYAVPGSDVGAARSSASPRSSLLTGANYRGITRTAAPRACARRGLARSRCWSSSRAIAASGGRSRRDLRRPVARHGGVYGVLQSAGLLFFAFAGYARIATLGEEVRDPERTIPRAIPIALGDHRRRSTSSSASRRCSRPGPTALAASTAPLADRRARPSGAAWALPVVRVGAAVASLGALLALIAGHRAHDAGDGAQRRPAALRSPPSTRATACPHRAELAVAAAVVACSC